MIKMQMTNKLPTNHKIAKIKAIYFIIKFTVKNIFDKFK